MPFRSGKDLDGDIVSELVASGQLLGSYRRRKLGVHVGDGRADDRFASCRITPTACSENEHRQQNVTQPSRRTYGTLLCV
jgi:hypothetical protein